MTRKILRTLLSSWPVFSMWTKDGLEGSSRKGTPTTWCGTYERLID